jgi:hypothetical protein
MSDTNGTSDTTCVLYGVEIEKRRVVPALLSVAGATIVYIKQELDAGASKAMLREGVAAVLVTLGVAHSFLQDNECQRVLKEYEKAAVLLAAAIGAPEAQA